MHMIIHLVGIIVLARFAVRALRWRRYGRHGGCGAFRAHHHRFHRGPFGWGRHRGPIDLGDMDGIEEHAGRARAYRVDVTARVDEIMRALELNARQAAEAGDVISALRGAVGEARYAHAPEILTALRAVSRAPFDAELAEAAIGAGMMPEAAKEALDALEHLHHILTDEQRATLARVTAR